VEAIRRLDQLRGDAYLVALLAHRTFEDRGNPERRCDLTQVIVLALVVKRRGTSGDLEILDLGPRIEDFFRHAIGKVFLVMPWTEIGEGQHSNGLGVHRGFLWRRVR
jgi:hypothetical protein